MATAMNDIRRALNASREQLLGKPNVVATGIGYKVTAGGKTEQLSIVCSVTNKLPRASLGSAEVVPQMVEGVPTDVVPTGVIRAFQTATDRWRPALGGVSIGHKDITAGTFGCLVKKNGEFYILSNNHVLANVNAGKIGDPILQPGTYDAGKYPDDHIADLADFVPINITGIPSDCNVATVVTEVLNSAARLMGSNTRLQAIQAQAGENLVDCAIAGPLQPDLVTDEILNIGVIQGVAEGELNMSVKKSGRTTGLTTGTIQQIDVTANVQLGEGRFAMFADQLMAGPMSQPGDSGSAVLDDQDRLVGLLFAGSDQTTLFNRIQNVFAALGVSR